MLDGNLALGRKFGAGAEGWRWSGQIASKEFNRKISLALERKFGAAGEVWRWSINIFSGLINDL